MRSSLTRRACEAVPFVGRFIPWALRVREKPPVMGKLASLKKLI
jgi:hypothetical protein